MGSSCTKNVMVKSGDLPSRDASEMIPPYTDNIDTCSSDAKNIKPRVPNTASVIILPYTENKRHYCYECGMMYDMCTTDHCKTCHTNTHRKKCTRSKLCYGCGLCATQCACVIYNGWDFFHCSNCHETNHREHTIYRIYPQINPCTTCCVLYNNWSFDHCNICHEIFGSEQIHYCNILGKYYPGADMKQCR